MSAIDELLDHTRSHLSRLEPRRAAEAVARGAVLVDIRPAAQRADEGEIPGALVIERNVLEWRLDPTSPDRIPSVARPGARIIVFCSEGYASSFAAASLRSLDIDATDLVDGFQGWAAAGLPIRLGSDRGSVGASDTARSV